MAAVGRAVVATSLEQAHTLRKTATRLVLSSSPDLACQNMMCQKFGGGCACRLALAVQRMPKLEEVDVSHNRLDVLPASLLTGKGVRRLDASFNALSGAALTGADEVSGSRIEELLLHGNEGLDVDAAALAAMPALRLVTVSGGADALRARLRAAARPGAAVPEVEERS